MLNTHKDKHYLNGKTPKIEHKVIITIILDGERTHNRKLH